MSATTYFGIELPGSESQDWMTALNAAFSTLTEVIVRTQLPSGGRLLWGDVAGGKYLEATSSGVRVVGGLNLGGTATRNFVVQQGTAFPTDYWQGLLFLRTDENVLYRRGPASWIALGDSSSEVIAAAGGLLIEDLGPDKGSIAVSDGASGVTQRAPGAARTVLHSDSAVASGWSLATVFSLIGYSLAKGQLAVGGAANATQAVSVGADDSLLAADSTTDSGVAWKTVSALLRTLLTARGQLLAGGAAAVQVVAAAVADDQVLVSRAAEDGGMKWIPQTELGSIPGTRTRVGADLYLYANFI